MVSSTAALQSTSSLNRRLIWHLGCYFSNREDGDWFDVPRKVRSQNEKSKQTKWKGAGK
jgi:hypothetical protein